MAHLLDRDPAQRNVLVEKTSQGRESEPEQRRRRRDGVAVRPCVSQSFVSVTAAGAAFPAAGGLPRKGQIQRERWLWETTEARGDR